MAQEEYFVCTKLKCTLSLSQCSLNQKKAKDKSDVYLQRLYELSCSGCVFYKTAKKYSLEQVLRSNHFHELEKCLESRNSEKIISRKINLNTDQIYES